MAKLKRSDHQIEIKQESLFLTIGFSALFMTAIGVQCLLEFSPKEDLSGFIVMCIWTLVVLSMSLFGFYSSSTRFIINDDGVCCKTLFANRTLHWEEIQDWGLSYSGRERGGSNIYDLYFSDHKCKQKNDYKKSLKGVKLKTYLTRTVYCGG